MHTPDTPTSLHWTTRVNTLRHPYWLHFYGRIYAGIFIVSSILILLPNRLHTSFLVDIMTILIFNLIVLVLIAIARLMTKKFDDMTYFLDDTRASFSTNPAAKKAAAQFQTIATASAIGTLNIGDAAIADSLYAFVEGTLTWSDVTRATYIDSYAVVVLRGSRGEWFRIFTNPDDYQQVKSFVSSHITSHQDDKRS